MDGATGLEGTARATPCLRYRLVLIVLCVAGVFTLISCSPAAHRLPPQQLVPRTVAQSDAVGSVSRDGRHLTHVKTGEYDDLFVRDLVTGLDRRLTRRPGEFSEGAPISPTGEIAFSWLLDGRREVRTVGLDGTELRVLHLAEADVRPDPEDWSPDGNEILLILANRRTKTSGLALLSVTTGSLRHLNSGLAGQPVAARFSPDGRWIAVQAMSSEAPAEDDIFVRPVDGRPDVTAVTTLGGDRLLGWTPDGGSILFASNRAGTWDLWQQPIRDGKAHGSAVLLLGGIGPVVRAAGITQDGSLYYVLKQWENDVYVATIGNSGRVRDTRKVAAHAAWDSTVQWSPDGRFLTYARGHGNRDGPFTLVVQDRETGFERRLPLQVTRFGGHFFTPNWAPDGRAILTQGRYEAARGGRPDSQGLYRIDVETGDATPLVQASDLCPPDCVEWPAWSPTGEILFVRWGHPPGTPRRLVALDPRSQTERELYRSVSGEEIHHIAVSPDGSRVAVAWWDRSGGRAGVKVMDSSGNNVRDLLSLPALADYWLPLFAMGWTPDSRYLVYAPTRGGEKQFELKRVPIDGGPPEDLGLLMRGIWPYGLSVHPDGRRIALTAGSPLRQEVWVLPVRTGTIGNGGSNTGHR